MLLNPWYNNLYARGFDEVRAPGPTVGVSLHLVGCAPILRDEHTVKVKPITPGRIHDIVHELYVKAGLLRENSGEPDTS